MKVEKYRFVDGSLYEYDKVSNCYRFVLCDIYAKSKSAAIKRLKRLRNGE